MKPKIWLLLIAALLAGGMAAGQYSLLQSAEQETDWLIGRARPLIDARYQGLWARLRGDGWIERLSAQPGPRTVREHPWLSGSLLQAPRVELKELRRSDSGTLEFLRVAIPAWSLVLPPDPRILAQGLPKPERGIYPIHLRRLGYTTLHGSAEMSLRFMPQARALTVELRLQITDLGELDLRFELDTDQLPFEELPEDLGLRFLNLTLVDRGLMPRYRDHIATSKHLSQPAAEADLVRAFNKYRQKVSLKLSEDSVLAISRFLRGNASLTVNMNPLADIALRDYELYAEGDLPLLLGAEASAQTLENRP